MRKAEELRNYQQRIITHLYQHDEAICVARMGGGKTAAALTAIQELKTEGVIRHALVIAPKRVACNVWPEEIAAWEHTADIEYTLLAGTKEQRRQRLLMAAAGFGGITIIGLDNVKWLLEELENYPDDHQLFDLLVIDEISKLKDPTGVRSKLLAKHAKRWNMIWGLSGTLRPNSALDLFAPVKVVTKGKLWGTSYYKWRQDRFHQTDFHGYQWEPLPGAEEVINEEIAPLCVTLQDKDMPQLPELSIIFDHVELPPAARAQYHTMHKKLVARIDEKQIVAANAAVATGKLAQLANGFMYAVDEEEGIGPRGPVTAAMVHDEKRQWLEDLIDEAEGPLLIVYEFLQDLQMIRDIVGGDIPYLGSGVTDATAKRYIENWNAGMFNYMALHPASGGHGLNLQAGGADMAWIAPTWSPEMWEQTIARLHRPGQTRPVFVRVCVAKDTVDQMKLDRVHYKMSAQAAFERYLATAASSSA